MLYIIHYIYIYICIYIYIIYIYIYIIYTSQVVVPLAVGAFEQNGHETDLEMSPRPLGTTVFEEI